METIQMFNFGKAINLNRCRIAAGVDWERWCVGIEIRWPRSDVGDPLGSTRRITLVFGPFWAGAEWKAPLPRSG